MSGPFLTDIDSRAAVKGSRDPLGLVPLWGRFGRHVVGNLTTVSGSVRGFVTLLLAYYFARRVRDERGGNEQSTLTLFLKFEQLAAYSRVHVHGGTGDLRGVERVMRALSGGGRLRLSARQEDLILSDQKTYGLWGLFSSPARASALLERREEILTPEAQSFVEVNYMPRLAAAGFRDGRAVVDLLAQDRSELQVTGRHAQLARAIAALHHEIRPPESAFFREHLLYGGPADATRGLQRLLAELMWEVDTTPDFDRRQLGALAKEAAHRGGMGAELARRLERIDHLEAILVPAALVFSLVLARHGGDLLAVAKEIGKQWKRPLDLGGADPIGDLRSEIAEAVGDRDSGDRWVELGSALDEGDWESSIRLLVEQNGHVMRSRNGSQAWVRLNGSRIDVRLQDETGGLAERDDLDAAWVNNYFLNPLKSVLVQLETV
jgi:hypothetical protein